MANHLTPDELSEELGISRRTLLNLCIQEGVPVFHGRIDKTLFVQIEKGRNVWCKFDAVVRV